MMKDPARKVSKLYSSTVARAICSQQKERNGTEMELPIRFVQSFLESIRQRGCVIPNHTTYYLNPQDPAKKLSIRAVIESCFDFHSCI